MHDEVSETENIRCNLGIEKMIVEGCDVILDANQVFIKEGLLNTILFYVFIIIIFVNLYISKRKS